MNCHVLQAVLTAFSLGTFSGPPMPLSGGLMQSMMHQKAMGFEMTPEMMKMMGGFTVLRLTSLMSSMDVKFTREQLLELNEKLNQIQKE